MAEIFEKTLEKPIFLTLDPLKIIISEIGLRHVLSWPNLGLEPKFHDPGTFGGFGKRGQTHRQDSCFISIDIIAEIHIHILGNACNHHRHHQKVYPNLDLDLITLK